MAQLDDSPAADASESRSDQRLFIAVLDAVPDAVVVVDADGVIIVANTQVRDVFGYERQELEGELVEILIPSRAREGHPQRRSGYPRRPMGLLQLAAVRKGGAEFPAEISLAPVVIGDGAALTVATVRDITERLRLQADAEQARNELLATVTHELRTPLTSILGYAEVMHDLDSTELGPEARRMLGVVQRNATRELTLVTDLLDVAVGALGQTKLTVGLVDVGTLVHDTGSGHAETARSAGLELVVTTDGRVGSPDAPLMMEGDAHRLQQVLDNLVGNAIKFTPPGGVVTVSAEALSDSVVLQVGDTGEGIALTDQGRIFERLFRGQNALAAESRGAGLGLSIVESIVTAHRGAVTIESTPGAGTLVTVQLPRTDDSDF